MRRDRDSPWPILVTLVICSKLLFHLKGKLNANGMMDIVVMWASRGDLNACLLKRRFFTFVRERK